MSPLPRLASLPPRLASMALPSGGKASFFPYGKTEAQLFAEQD
ncbi:MAG TPA: hypothetical protein VFR81_16485 [Longimicrobium sp.]|nr:hypothetical protein [Longimicrobium sp.]